ncbi:MAG TPA: C40 family peptidase [Pseudonocardiaceae bacterium]|nr:C40 family peptidase [Pseudonocardiaceae bacterium]
MASKRLKRTMRGAMTAGVVIAAVTFAAPGATADPSTSSGSSDPMGTYDQLSQQADALNEQLNDANTQLAAKQAEQVQAKAAQAAAEAQEQTAQGQEDQFRASVDNLTAASFEGARMDQLSALLTGESARDYLDRSTDLQNLAATNYAVLAKYQAAVDAAAASAAKAEAAAQQAQDAINAAQALMQQVQQKSAQLNQQLAQVSQAMGGLSASDRAQLSSIGPNLVVVPPPGVRGRMVMAALSKRGKSYVWGAAGPSSFDCSGLVLWAYAQAGVTGIPHSSSAQSEMGTAVSKDDLEIGDLVFFGSPVHHVGIYVGNGYMVDAPETGEVVRIQPIWPSGYEGARRLD